MRRSILIFFVCVGFLAIGQTPHRWLHIYRNITDFSSFKISDIESVGHINTATDDAMIQIAAAGEKIEIPVSEITDCVVGTNVPTIYITLTDFPDKTEITDKETYLDATISIDGNGVFEDMAPTAVTVKGRGNSTWTYPKKPYRLKFKKKTSLLDFDKAKSYVLIANYIDCTLMRNAVALKIAQMLDMPYTNHAQPVRVYLNGILKGAYLLTEKIGISSASVDIDQNQGVLFELDTNFDETYKFRTARYDIPVMIKDPDLDEIAAARGVSPDELLQMWKADFGDFEEKVYNGTAVAGKDFDMKSLVDFMVVYNICDNHEIGWPKSTYLYKTSADSPYFFGPVWDFDWAFTYKDGCQTDRPAREPLFSPWDQLKALPFFVKICSMPEFRELFAQRLAEFKTEMLPQLLDYIDAYAEAIRPSAIENGVLWPADGGRTLGSFEFDKHVDKLKAWLKARTKYITTHPNYGLYD